jgi:DNA adenine methylase
LILPKRESILRMRKQYDSSPRPVLRWAGSKRQTVERLAKFWGTGYARYVEPFAGSAALYFTIRPACAVIADTNRDLIETYQVLCECPAELHARVTAIPRSKQVYYDLRSKDPSELPTLERAVRFLYLNRYCFNGLYRTNTKGQFNVPYAPSGTGGFPSSTEFEACARLLSTAKLHSWDFGTTLRYVHEGDFVYLDPPYAVESRRVFREYGAFGFGKSQLARLVHHLRRIDERGAAFVLTYADCAEARRLFSEWRQKRIAVRRNIAGFAGARRRAFELLISNLPDVTGL